MCQAVSVVSGLYPGVSPATHSPQPITPSTFTSTNTMRRSSVRIVLVSNGATNFIRSSRSVISRICISCDVPSPHLDLKIAPGREQIRCALLTATQSYHRVLTREPFHKLLAHARLHGL